MMVSKHSHPHKDSEMPRREIDIYYYHQSFAKHVYGNVQEQCLIKRAPLEKGFNVYTRNCCIGFNPSTTLLVSKLL